MFSISSVPVEIILINFHNDYYKSALCASQKFVREGNIRADNFEMMLADHYCNEIRER